ncbi:permease-like cell division protein FtsX [Amycolatopsis sp. NPDC049868]|uniref:permease-like cell division protein FtsX n=1 Tax=Amycolatopsis sp. NPDC049868 TaxID=3363934 RepID=UPI0037903D79
MARTDDDMMTIAEALRGDLRVMRVYTETKQEAYKRFSALFASQPELLELTGPEALPAVVTVIPMDQTEPDALADQFRTQFPAAQSVKSSTEYLSRLGVSQIPDQTCPSSGERPWPTI